MEKVEKDNLVQTRAAYESNKVRKQERWFDWSQQGDALDGFMEQRKRREVDPVPYDVGRSPTPVNKRFEMDPAFASTASEYKATRDLAETVKIKGRLRPTSIFGGQQLVVGNPGKGWRDPHYDEKPVPAETSRNLKMSQKYESSSFPAKYEEFCNREHFRMSRRAVGQ
mmetsp:Transcript_13504/g.16088  ORF Transcript_13504/g.16088 Transcript_13504/m.16088 type:complete len:168 (-) Transcript_13504:178-681(-)|eukprot:CAMPEP_0114361404 /NCGR_PEP_ID=MMETSP0101-20121206/24695_1 /TAXON_ID=38822 ORGANISM="Pteridomonas danica, Strain PT" /NCGR_SAMPLE_ID=MMETSP0101 /ASSEMBLY_ACC=CAM_ASM_000211 /LENGTH=167 /DNA_ID=CAMNT_0001506337 /DNA_START=117 /DNA_END=620 /DNA_ORIENTATION=+